MSKGIPVTSNGRMVQVLPNEITARGAVATAGTAYSLGNPLIFVHGLNTVSTNHITCEGAGGLWSNPINYLKTVANYTGTGNGKAHPGLGGDTIKYDGLIDTIGFYDNDVRCQHQINTRTGMSY